MDAAAAPPAGPLLALDGFAGTLDRLLDLARTGQLDLARLALPDLLDQLATGLAAAPTTAAIGVRADWLVMAAWLLLLRSRLLLPPPPPAGLAADGEADPLGQRQLARREVAALADWLERRPQLGRHIFAAGCRTDRECANRPGGASVDVVEFLWASQALFDGSAPASPEPPPRAARRLDLHAPAEARTRILALLAEAPDGRPLGRLLPQAGVGASPLRARSRWTSTLVAGLELAREGRVVLEQQSAFAPIHLDLTPGPPPDQNTRSKMVITSPGST